MTNNNSHSRLPPSSAARRMACPGSRTMEERYGRNKPTDASTEGDLAHELAAIYLRNDDWGKNLLKNFTQEMHEGAQFYVKTVKHFLNTFHVEKKVEISSVHPEMWGTPDAWGVDELSIHVFDYKFGFTPIEAYENWQLLSYACGIIENYPEVPLIFLHIIQPRDYVSLYKHKTWCITKEQLETYRQRLQISEALAMSLNAPLQVSEQCKYCKARYACPALQKAAFGATEVTFRDVPQGLSPKEIGSELKLLHEARDLLEYRITALETEVLHFLSLGHPVDHYELKPTESRLNWSVGPDEVKTLGALFGKDLSKGETVTPTQAIKMGIPEETILRYAERKKSLKLSKIDLTKSKEVFGK